MAFTIKKSWFDALVFGLSVFLVFCLIFESFIQLPPLVGWLGNWHPLILHFPIVLLILAVYTNLFHKKISSNFIALTTITALITAISGFFLSSGSNEKGDILFWHQWLGAGVALLTAIWYYLEGQQLGQHIFSKILQISLVVIIVFTGHYGGMITHGEDFLALPKGESFKEIPKDPIIYEHIVAQIVDDKCVSCHNPNKQKGEYTMTSLKGLIKGGKTGIAIDLEHPEQSELLKRIHLPREDEKHMPPSEKKQLTSTEIKLIEEWIKSGATDTLQLHHLNSDAPLAALVKTFTQPDATLGWSKLPKVDENIIENLSSDYLTINKLSSGANALSINMYNPPEYSSDMITALVPIAENIITMDFSGLPISGKELTFIGICTNLEKLEIDRTLVSDSTLTHLKTLNKLKVLKIFETNITDASIETLNGLQNLEKLFIKDTKITNTGINKLQQAKPSIQIFHGIDEDIVTFFVKDSIEEVTKIKQ